jgi:hypothetical protein
MNIYPRGIAGLKRHGRDVTADLSDVVELGDPISARCGFLLAETRLRFAKVKQLSLPATLAASALRDSSPRVLDPRNAEIR